jgi:hypothetical protein
MAAFEESNQWMDAQYGMPILTNTALAVTKSLASQRRYLEVAFSEATLHRIDELLDRSAEAEARQLTRVA